MGPLKFITRCFIDFFSITQPTPEEERKASWFIAGLLVLVVLGVAAAFGIVILSFHR